MIKKTKEQRSYDLSQVKSKNTSLAILLCNELNKRGIKSFIRNDKSVYGNPDIVFKAYKLAVFCDNEFSHENVWENKKAENMSDQFLLISKIEENIKFNSYLTKKFQIENWTVLCFGGNEIKSSLSDCVDEIEFQLHKALPNELKTIDLCAGIGGIRKGFELTGRFKNVLSAEIDKYACKTYQHLFGDNPYNDLTTEEFKTEATNTVYDVLLAGFPCQTFSRVGLGEGFENEEKGKIFFHISNIIKCSRPCAFFLENVDHIVTRDKGKTFQTILEILVIELNYHVIGVSINENGKLQYSPKDFIRNSKNFGVPQNRPRTYIVGFDKERFISKKLEQLPTTLPVQRDKKIYTDLNDLLETKVQEKYYMASGYFDTLIRHRERQENKGYGFGYRVVNEVGIERPIANSLLATGGSGKERNLIYDPQEGIGGKEIKGKKTPLNDEGIRVMTPTEWGKLQGFINYAFLDNEGVDRFSFPDGMANAQKYKQFGNSVTIPVIEEMAKFMLECFRILE